MKFFTRVLMIWTSLISPEALANNHIENRALTLTSTIIEVGPCVSTRKETRSSLGKPRLYTDSSYSFATCDEIKNFRVNVSSPFRFGSQKTESFVPGSEIYSTRINHHQAEVSDETKQAVRDSKDDLTRFMGPSVVLAACESKRAQTLRLMNPSNNSRKCR